MSSRRLSAWLLFASALASTLTAGQLQGQEYEVARRTYNFYDGRLDIEVLANSAGQLQILHGDMGRIEVAAHASAGIAASALATERGSILTLTALGARSAEYIVVVPERTDVRVRLPGKSGWSNASSYSTSRFRWDSVPEPAELDYSYPRPSLEGRYYVLTSRLNAPARVRLLNDRHIRSIEVRVEGTEFLAASTRPLSLSPGVKEYLDINPGSQDVDLVVQVPSYSARFDLVLGDKRLVRIENGVVTRDCGPGVAAVTSRGMQRLVFKPQTGMVCGGG